MPDAPTPVPKRSRFRHVRHVRHLRHVPGAVVWTSAILVVLVVVIFTFHFADEPLRRSMERKINEALTGYTVTVPRARFGIFGLSVKLDSVRIVQTKNPDPPVAFIPQLKASLLWRELLHFHIASDFIIREPRVRIDLAQFRKERSDSVDIEDRGWQDAAQAVTPFKINMLEVADADLVYIDEDPDKPLHVSHLAVHAGNIRNVHSKESEYPSTIHAEGVIFDKGHGMLDGRADFLAKPSPALYFTYNVGDVPLDNLRPILDRQNFTLKGGTLASAGTVQMRSGMKNVRIYNVSANQLRLDYHHNLPRAIAGVHEEVAKVNDKPNYTLRIDTIAVQNGEFGMMRLREKHSYRLFLKNASLMLLNYSNRFAEGEAIGTLRGDFMGSGRTAARIVLRPEKVGPDFDVNLAIENTQLVSMNEVLRAHGKLDVTKGTMSFYSQLTVHNNELRGYAKPLLRDVKVYSWKQDKHNNVFNQLYELIVSGALKLFKNHKTDEVATRASIRGHVGTTHTSAWEVIANAFENAFIKEIAPGFDKVVSKKK